MKIELTPLNSELVCSYCRSEACHPLWTCDSCGVSLHEDCRLELKSCPTVGCATNSRAEAPRPSPTLSIWRRGFLGRLWVGLSEEEARYTRSVVIGTAVLCLIPSLACGIAIAAESAKTRYFGFDWWQFTKVVTVATSSIMAFFYVLALPFLARLAAVWRALRH